MAFSRIIHFLLFTLFFILFISIFGVNLKKESIHILPMRRNLYDDIAHHETVTTETVQRLETVGFKNFTKYLTTTESAKRIVQDCSKGTDLVGPLFVNKETRTWKQLREELGFVKDGGYYSPITCRPVVKTAIIIPYRNREEHLKILLRQIHPMLKRQNIYYQVFVINQADDSEFNRGKLMNVGFAEALKRSDFNCFVFHDVDLIPEDDRIFYGCPHSPMHLSVAIDKFYYQLIYEELFGGIEMFRKEDFKKINGFSNAFWGWGAEDDNLYDRVSQHGLKIFRPPIEIARYQMIEHEQAPIKEERIQVYLDSIWKTREDGLSSLKYEVKDTFKYALYTKINVDLLKNPKH